MKRQTVWRVPSTMSRRQTLLVTACLRGLAAQRAQASGFTAFAEDEDVCRKAGAAAINGASGPTAAQRYDTTYGRCMAAHIRMRQMAGPSGPDYPVGNPHGFEYPDAFYSVPYATPGYGYDGFSY